MVLGEGRSACNEIEKGEERNDDKKGLSKSLSPFWLCQSQAVFKVTSVGRC